MNIVDVKFPQYRKYQNNTSFFKILSPRRFIEIQVLGSSYFRYDVEAKSLPDFHLINDMINEHNNHWVGSNEREFELIFERYQSVIL